MSGPWYKPRPREVRPGCEPTSPPPGLGQTAPHKRRNMVPGGSVPCPRLHHNEGKQGPGPEPEGGDKDLPANLHSSFSEPALLLEERVATASARVTHGAHPPVSSPWSHAREQPWGIGAGGFPTRKLHPASWTDRGRRDCRLCPLGRKSGAGPPGPPSPPACQDSAHMHLGEGGSRGQRSNSGRTGDHGLSGRLAQGQREGLNCVSGRTGGLGSQGQQHPPPQHPTPTSPR